MPNLESHSVTSLGTAVLFSCTIAIIQKTSHVCFYWCSEPSCSILNNWTVLVQVLNKLHKARVLKPSSTGWVDSQTYLFVVSKGGRSIWRGQGSIVVTLYSSNQCNKIGNGGKITYLLWNWAGQKMRVSPHQVTWDFYKQFWVSNPFVLKRITSGEQVGLDIPSPIIARPVINNSFTWHAEARWHLRHFPGFGHLDKHSSPMWLTSPRALVNGGTET